MPIPARAFFICALFALGLQAADSDPWIDVGYLKRIAITNLSPANPAESLTDFPVLVAITNATWLDPAKTDGGDITFAGVDGKQLFHDIEFFGRDGAGLATVQAWVCLPTFSNKTLFYMYWKNTAANLPFNGSNTTTNLNASFSTLKNSVIRARTWDTNYMVVFHFSDLNTLPQDATANNLHVTTTGTNIYSNQQGIGIGMGNSMQMFNNSGWGGYLSTNMYYSNGSTWNVKGLHVSGLANNTANPAHNRISNDQVITHSLWMRFPQHPTNNWTNVWFGGSESAGANAGIQAAIIGINRMSGGWGECQTDGLGSMRISTTNNNAINICTRGVATVGGNLTNLARGPAGYYSNWMKLDIQSTPTASFANYSVRVAMNGAVWGSNLGATNTGIPYGGLAGLSLMGSHYYWVSPTPTTNRLVSPYCYFDEYRLSAVLRSSNWLVTEYSNVISTTNMSQLNGAEPTALHVYGHAAITNSAPLIPLGHTFRGFITPAALPSARLIIKNASSTEVYNQFVTSNSLWDWSATPTGLATGPYSAYIACTNSLGVLTNSPSVYFDVRIASTLTVKSESSTGVPWVGGRIAGPSPTPFPIEGICTNDANGEVVFPNQLSSATIALTNFTPVAWGGAFLVSNFVMPESNLILTWVFDSAPPPATATNASMRLDSVAFAPSQAAFLRLSIPQASNATVRVVVSATPLAGGRRVFVFDGSASPAYPNIQIPAETLRAFMHPGTWILEFQFPKTGTDRSKVITTRRLLFYFQ
jgi:hypothetical protein